MRWNWQLPDWPEFKYNLKEILSIEKEFLVGTGKVSAYLKFLSKKEYHDFIIEILSIEGEKSAKIEGEILDRKSLQSSIKKHFKLDRTPHKNKNKESQMAELLFNIYDSFDKPLSHKMLYKWHSILMKGETHISNLGKYRTHKEPMQIISNRLDSSKVFFQAPPSKSVYKEMNAFILWFNASKNGTSILGRAAQAHVYFESIHPFEDGNGRIGRALVEKILSQEMGYPILIAISQSLEKEKKTYYLEFGKCNQSLNIGPWVSFFSHTILKAHQNAMNLLYFLVKKSKMLHALSGNINARQTKALLRILAEGPSGFKGGLSTENYISITKTSRATATRDLTDLVTQGALIKTGTLRYTRYWLNL